MTTKGRKILSDILARRGRTVLVALSIMVGVFGVVVLVGVSDLIVQSIEENLQEDKMAMNRVYVALPVGQSTFEQNQALLKTVRELPGITDAEGQAFYRTAWRESADGDAAGYQDAHIMAFSEGLEEADLEPVARKVSGDYPGPGEVAVELRFAEKYGVEEGDRLVFRSPTSAGEPLEYEVSGVVFYPYMAFSPAIANMIPTDEMIFSSYADAQAITGFPGLSSIYVRYEDYARAEAAEEELVSTIVGTRLSAEGSGPGYVKMVTWLDNPTDSLLMQQVTGVTQILNMLAILSMVVSAFLVVNVINTIVVEQKQQIGVMKSMGATRLDIFQVYAGMALLYGVIGTLLGVLVGVPVAGIMARDLAYSAFTYIDGIQISGLGVLVGAVLGLLVPVAVAIVPVYNGTRVSILEAMTDLGISSRWGRGWFSHIVRTLPLPVTIRQALSNVAQKTGRLFLTGLTLTLAVGSFMGVTAVFISINEQIQSIFDAFDYQIDIAPQTPQDYATLRDDLLANIDGIEGVYPAYGATVNLEGYESQSDFTAGTSQIIANGVDPDASVMNFDLAEGEGFARNVNCMPAYSDGQQVQQADERCFSAVITQSVAGNAGLQVGDMATFLINGQRYEFEVVGIDRFPFDNVYLRWDVLAGLSDYTDDAGNPLPSNFALRMTADDPTIAEVDAKIAEVEAHLLDRGIQAVYTNQLEAAEQQAEQISVFLFIFNIASGVMAAVGAIGLLATLSMAVHERQKEIGVMRSIGASSGTVAIQFLVEGLVVGVGAWVVGLPLSYLLALGLSDALPFGEFDFNYSPYILLAGLGGIIVVSTIASLWPALSAARKTISDILRYQ